MTSAGSHLLGVLVPTPDRAQYGLIHFSGVPSTPYQLLESDNTSTGAKLSRLAGDDSGFESSA